MKIKIPTQIPKKGSYEFFLRKILEGSNIHLTNKEYKILQCMYDTEYKWDTQYMKKELTMDTFSLNNYKRYLNKKKLIYKEGDDTVTAKPFRLNLNDSKIELTFIIEILDEEISLLKNT